MNDNIPGLFVTGTGTSVGKTFVARALARSARRAGLRIAALKPIETGCAPEPADALALARAAGRPELARAPGLYRAGPPLSPQAAASVTGEPPPSAAALASRCRELAAGSDRILVEGAGGLLVPLDAHATMADLARELALPLLLVAADRLGVLSDVLCYAEVAAARGLPLAAVVLNRINPDSNDDSPRLNRRILSERLACPVLAFPLLADDDDALAAAAAEAGLTTLLELPPNS